MSFWGATVITNMVTAIPNGIGKELADWLWGGYSVGKPTLQRFFTLHYFLPFVITGLVGLHIYFLHLSGSNNPLGVVSVDNTPLAHNFMIKDSFGIFIYLFVFLYVITFHPNYLAHPDNYIKANCLMTPRHVVPEWYFLPYYAMLRCIPHKSAGILIMLGSIFMFFFLPLINRS
jgi:quinol-cytochrome oxidoreductase complex cytochrome b subunit